ncbi:MAG: SSI family serine proteinase inhibitor [Gaiellaceae bacterium]
MRVYAALVLGAVALTVAGLALAGTPTGTSLRVTYWKDGANENASVRWVLRCSPPRGTLRRPAVACRKLAAGGPKLFAPIPLDSVCTEIYGGPQRARVVGTVRGKRIWATFSRENGCAIDRWSRVSPWLLPPGGDT